MLSRLWIAAVISVCSAWGGTIQLSPPSQSASVGQMITLSVAVTSVADLYAYQFDLAFDPTVLQAPSVTEDSYLSNGGPTLFIPGAIDNVDGFVFATADSLEGASGVSGSGTLADFNFQAIATGQTSVDLQNVFLLDSTLSGVVASEFNGSVTVTAAPEPSCAPGCFALVVGAGFFGWRSRPRVAGSRGIRQ